MRDWMRDEDVPDEADYIEPSIQKNQTHGMNNMVFVCRHVLSGQQQPEKPICYRDGVYACKECRDMKQRGIMPDIKVVHPECLVDLGIMTR